MFTYNFLPSSFGIKNRLCCALFFYNICVYMCMHTHMCVDLCADVCDGDQRLMSIVFLNCCLYMKVGFLAKPGAFSFDQSGLPACSGGVSFLGLWSSGVTGNHQTHPAFM